MDTFLARADQFELGVCLKINALSRVRIARDVFRLVSRLGDGIWWYSAMLMLAIAGGVEGAIAMLHTGITSLIGVWVYSGLKNRLVRPRPYVSYGAIVCRIAPLDQYSFPSGHTLHAVLFTIMLGTYAPPFLFAVLLPFAVLVAMSRIVLGLHYPSDVLVGAALGAILALVSLCVVEPTAIEYSLRAEHLRVVWRL